MFSFPYLPKAAFPDDVQIVEHALFYFSVLMQFDDVFDVLSSLFDGFAAVAISDLFFVFLLCQVFGVFQLEPGFFLGVNHEVIRQLVTNVVKLNA